MIERAASGAPIRDLRPDTRAKALREAIGAKRRARGLQLLAPAHDGDRRDKASAATRGEDGALARSAVLAKLAAAMAATVIVTLGLQHLIVSSNAPDAALELSYRRICVADFGPARRHGFHRPPYGETLARGQTPCRD